MRDFCKAGADIISFHVEAEEDVTGTIEKIVACGAKPALAVKTEYICRNGISAFGQAVYGVGNDSRAWVWRSKVYG